MTIPPRGPKAQDLHRGEVTVIINIFKAVPFPAPQGEKEAGIAREQSLAVGQAGMEGMEGHRDQPQVPGTARRE